MTIEHSVLLGVNIPHMTRWVERLERNEDPQTTGYLHVTRASHDSTTPEGFCCLGLACEEAKKDGAVVSQTINNKEWYDGSYTTLPKSVLAWLGWPDDCVSGIYNESLVNRGTNARGPHDDSGSLVTDNDTAKKTFPEIAAIVRREWLEPAIAVQGVSAETK